ncbi:uncharacterized protein FA14DRAFT_174643 [Meira miltonrushii]|uniref:Uncharacterized protein n=1 Tax=Meira miltonrushii TaxID=1280837 RepID=A0A316V616_9BASI|nr:uncharacterized protein FA14DRAFT_174643 [Meira miltonrushii]PWN33000.1 hypothetical protein FA14DRAFT_174643 [Meira miltonrushii]
MFTLTVIHDTIKVLASQLNADVIASLTHNINAKYSNRILPNVGLCVAHFDFLDVSEGHIRHGDGNTYYKTTFRLVVFRPFIGEILVGKVKSSDENGLRITMGFFDDIHITPEGMPQPSAYDRQEAAWFWVWLSEESENVDAILEDAYESKKDERFYIYKDELVRFVIDGDEFNEPEPPGPNAWKESNAGKAPGQTGTDAITVDTSKRIAPYKIKASMSIQGTGMVNWWSEAQAVEGSE